MRIDVALLPSLLETPSESVCVVVDALRATSSIATMFARGIEEVVVTATTEEALALKAGPLPDHLLCGEVGGLPPEGFDHGNSAAEFSRMDLRGRSAIIATSNGTRALVHASQAPVVFTGSLLNGATVSRAAVEEAMRRELTVVFVCAGTEQARAFSLEDTAVCGALVEAVVRDYPRGLDEMTLSDSAMAAYRVWRSYVSPRLAFGEARHGQALAALGLSEDLDFCAQADIYAVAPRLRRDGEGLFVLRA